MAAAPEEAAAFPLACDSGEVSGPHCRLLTSGMRCPHAHWFNHILQDPLQLGPNTAFLSLCIFLLPSLHWFRTWPGKRGLIWGAPLDPNLYCEKKVKVPQSCPTLWDPMEKSPGQNMGVGSLSLLQGTIPTQESNPGLPHCRWILYQLSHKGNPRILEWVAYPFSSRSSRPRNRTGVSHNAGGFFTN